jgi:hypothetical protein
VIHHHIDLGTVLRGTVCALYSNLVTRPTGAAVRSEIERAIAEVGGRTVTVIDFSEVTLLDFSCADEIVAKLMLRYCAPAASVAEAQAIGEAQGYFVFRALGDRHLDAVEAVLERHGLAIVAVIDGRPHVVGEVSAEERTAWELLHAIAPADATRLAAMAGASLAEAEAVLERLARRRLVMPVAGGWAPVGHAGILPGGSSPLGHAPGRAA